MSRRGLKGTGSSTPTERAGGRYSALTAFGLVPSGLAGVDLEEPSWMRRRR